MRLGFHGYKFSFLMRLEVLNNYRIDVFNYLMSLISSTTYLMRLIIWYNSNEIRIAFLIIELVCLII